MGFALRGSIRFVSVRPCGVRGEEAEAAKEGVGQAGNKRHMNPKKCPARSYFFFPSVHVVFRDRSGFLARIFLLCWLGSEKKHLINQKSNVGYL